MNLLLFINWRLVNFAFTALAWCSVVVFVGFLVMQVPGGSSAAHHLMHVVGH